MCAFVGGRFFSGSFKCRDGVVRIYKSGQNLPSKGMRDNMSPHDLLMMIMIMRMIEKVSRFLHIAMLIF